MPSLKEAYQYISSLYPTGYMDLKGIQPVNFTIDDSGAPVTNLTDLTLDADGQIIGVFAGKIHVSYAISGADTDVNVTVNKHTDFGDTSAVVPVFELVRSKDVAADPVGDNFTEEIVVATSVTIDGSNNGNFILNFDGYIIPIIPAYTIESDETTLDFGDVTNGQTSSPMSFELRWQAKPSAAPMVLTFPSRRQGCLTEDGVYEDSLSVELGLDEIQTIYVKFSPNAVANFDDTILIESEGTYSKTINVLGDGI